MASRLAQLSDLLLLIWLDRRSRRNRRQYPAMAIFAHDFIGNQIAVLGRFEREELRALEPIFRAIGAGGIAVDVGANIGNHALAFAEHFSRVECFEPNPPTFALLSLNTAGIANVGLHPVGLSSRTGEFDAFVPSANAGRASIGSAGREEGTTVKFRLACYDDLSVADERVALVKIDVEGHEAEALEGMKAALMRDWPIVMFECNRKSDPTSSRLAIEKLREIGFDRFASLRPSIAAIPEWIPRPLRMLWRTMEALARPSLRLPRLRAFHEGEAVDHPLVLATRSGTAAASVVGRS